MISQPSHSRTFTLIELLTIVTMIAILAAIAVPNFLEAQVRSKVSRVRSDMAMTSAALESYRLDHGYYPWQSAPLRPIEVQHLNDQLGRISAYGIPTLLDMPTSLTVTPTPPPTPTPSPYGQLENPFMEEDFGIFGPPTAGFGAPNSYFGMNQPSIDPTASTSATLARLGFVYTPFNGNGLYALTTPVRYISAPYLRDPFSDRMIYRSTGSLYLDPVMCYVNLQQIDPRGVTMDGLGANLPYVLYSASPETQMKIFPFPPIQPLVLYDPTNGTVSHGTLFNWRE